MPVRGEAVELGIRAGEQLLGTCKSLADLGPEYEAAQNDSSFCIGLDDTAMCCQSCNWWCEPCEIGDNGDCEDCGG